MMKIKAHPLIMLDKIKPFLFVLVLPLIKGLLQYVFYKKVSGILSLEIAAFLIIFLVAFLQYISFCLEIDGDVVVVKNGFFIRRTSFVELSQVSSLSFKQNLIEKLFRAITVYMNTDAGEKGKADFKFRISVKNAEKLSKTLYGAEERKTIKFSPLKIAIWAATTSSAFSGLLIGVPIINRVGDLLGLALYEMLVDEITAVSSKFDTYMPPVVNTVTLIFLLAYGVGFFYHLLKNIRFSLRVGERTLKIKGGLITERKSLFNRNAVNNVCIEQTFLMRFALRCAMYASVGGYGGNRSEKAVIAPCGKRKELIKGFLSVFDCLNTKNSIYLRPARVKGALRRFLWLPFLIIVLNISVAVVLAMIFPYFDRLIIFLSTVTLGIITYWADLCYYNYKCGKLCLGENILAIGSKGLKTRELYCCKSKVGSIKLRETPSDRRLGTCKIRIKICSESADSVWVRNLSRKSVIVNLSKIYDLNLTE